MLSWARVAHSRFSSVSHQFASGTANATCLRTVRFASTVLPNDRRNIAVIAHVDHGKTTLVDGLLALNANRTSGELGERAMDSNVLEKERGITILSKCTAINYLPQTKDSRLHKINIVDTPGHADFGGEVERVMGMVDGVLLVVCATEGPMTQTRFVLGKAFKAGLRPILVINKVDRPTARVAEVESEVFDLVASLDATEEQMEYPTIYASAYYGWATTDVNKALAGKMSETDTHMRCILDTIIKEVPPPKGDPKAPFSFLVSQLEQNKFFGKCLAGKIHSGKLKVGDVVAAVDSKGETIVQNKVTKIMTIGLQQIQLEEASAGDLVSIAGLSEATVGNTLTDPENVVVIPAPAIDPPTLSILVSTNSSPLMGKDGTKMTSTQIRERLFEEAETNVSLKVRTLQESEAIEVQGRGEMQLGVLVENLRREGFELSLEPPKVVMRQIDGEEHEPLEELVVDVGVDYSETVLKHIQARKGLLTESGRNDDRCRIVAKITTRGLIGLRAVLTTETRGDAVVNTRFLEYIPHEGPIDKPVKGSLVSMETGKSTAYALEPLQARGSLYIEPGTEVYEGMVIGVSTKAGDLNVNPVRTKKLTNVRSTAKEDNVRIIPPIVLTLEDCIGSVKDDEMVEVTPKVVRLRKQILSETDRAVEKRNQRAARGGKK
eukprot:g60074.t1